MSYNSLVKHLDSETAIINKHIHNITHWLKVSFPLSGDFVILWVNAH